MASDLVAALRAASPFPSVGAGGDLEHGLSVRQSSTCEKCKDRRCAGPAEELVEQPLRHRVCWRGLSVVDARWEFGKLTWNGLIVRDLNPVPNKDMRRTNRSQRVDWHSITHFYDLAGLLERRIAEEAEVRTKEAVESLHDVRTAVGLVMRNAEVIVGGLPGYTDKEKIESAPDELKSLLKSVRLLQTRLAMSSLLSNPESASYGNKRTTPVYRVFDRVTHLFSEQASLQRITVRMGGSSSVQPACFDSFETIPLVLLDNAIKYSCKGATVNVVVRDVSAGVLVSVDSYGPIVPPSMRQSIFLRTVRAEAARQFASSGSGLGLHLAKVVADAHGFNIAYECRDEGDDPRFGRNVFSFLVPDR